MPRQSYYIPNVISPDAYISKQMPLVGKRKSAACSCQLSAVVRDSKHSKILANKVACLLVNHWVVADVVDVFSHRLIR